MKLESERWKPRIIELRWSPRRWASGEAWVNVSWELILYKSNTCRFLVLKIKLWSANQPGQCTHFIFGCFRARLAIQLPCDGTSCSCSEHETWMLSANQLHEFDVSFFSHFRYYIYFFYWLQSLVSKASDVTRSTVQKSVCVLSRWLWGGGLFRVKALSRSAVLEDGIEQMRRDISGRPARPSRREILNNYVF